MVLPFVLYLPESPERGREKLRASSVAQLHLRLVVFPGLLVLAGLLLDIDTSPIMTWIEIS